MNKLRDKMKSVQLVMLMTLLFCIVLCPHEADAGWDEYSVYQPSIECQDWCDGPEPDENTDLCENVCVYEYRSDTSRTVDWGLNQFDWTQVTQSCDEPNPPVCYTDIMANICSRSFAIRHLDTIILRV